jgi:diguanylate cyclase (GGDEF)-like protein
MVLMMLATFVAFLKIRDTIFLTYAVYLFSYLFFQLSMNGFFSHFLSPLPLEYANITTHTSLVLVVLGGALFSGQYLQIWSGKYPKIRLLYYLIILNSLLGFLIAPTINYALGVPISVVSGLLLPPIVLLGAIYSLYSGYAPAKYFLAAWSIFLFGIFMSGLVFLGLIPHTFVTAHSMQLGSTLELLLLSYALIERINTLHKDKEIATEDANKYLNQINEGLESLVAERTKELKEKNKLLGELAIRDSMTGMLNHNASIEKLSSMKSAAIRYGYKLAVVMIDIDFFKSINDKYGHPAGDMVIIQIADVINHSIRLSDSEGRYGGEEFILLLHDTDAHNAVELSERIRTSIEALKIPEIGNKRVSASFGIAVFDSSSFDADIIKHADTALYEAKKSGRNRVVVYNS